jgi:hypothetical protein
MSQNFVTKKLAPLPQLDGRTQFFSDNQPKSSFLKRSFWFFGTAIAHGMSQLAAFLIQQP